MSDGPEDVPVPHPLRTRSRHRDRLRRVSGGRSACEARAYSSAERLCAPTTMTSNAVA